MRNFIFYILVIMFSIVTLLLTAKCISEGLESEKNSTEKTIVAGDGERLKCVDGAPICPYCRKVTPRIWESYSCFGYNFKYFYDMEGNRHEVLAEVGKYRCLECGAVYFVGKNNLLGEIRYVDDVNTVKNWIKHLNIGD